MEKKKLPFGKKQIETLERLNYLAKKLSSKGLPESEAEERDRLEDKVKNMLAIW